MRKFGWLAAIWLFSLCGALAQTDAPPLRSRQPVESELGVIGGGTVGNLHVFAYAEDRQLNLFGLQYMRHSWGTLLSARVDYMAEALPAVLLNEPKAYLPTSVALTTERKTTYGADIAPLGIRLLWRRHQQWKPYLLADGGFIYFTHRVISTEGTKLNFSAQFGGGMQWGLRGPAQLRIGYSIYHISNAGSGMHNPGLDTNLIYAVLSFNLHR